MRIRTKLVAFAAGMSLMAPVVGGVAYNRMEAIEENFDIMAEEVVPDLLSANLLREAQAEQLAAALAYATSGEPAAAQRFTKAGEELDGALRAGAGPHHTPNGATQLQQLVNSRNQFSAAGLKILNARAAYEHNFETLRTKDNELTEELGLIRQRYATTNAANSDYVLPQYLRYQINDLLLGTEGLQHIVALQFAQASSYAVRPDDITRRLLDTSNLRFQGWYQVAWNASGPEERAILLRVQTKAAEFESAARAMIESTDQFTTSRALLLSSAADVNATLDELAKGTLDEMGHAHLQAEKTVEHAVLIIGLLSLVGLMLGGFAGVWFAGAISRPLTQLRDATDRVSRGELDTVEIPAESEDELGELAVSFRRMIASLKFMMRKQAGGEDGNENDRMLAS